MNISITLQNWNIIVMAQGHEEFKINIIEILIQHNCISQIRIIDVKWERYRNEDHEWMCCNIKCNNKNAIKPSKLLQMGFYNDQN